jgi:hypothetical protein
MSVPVVLRRAIQGTRREWTMRLDAIRIGAATLTAALFTVGRADGAAAKAVADRA